MPAVAAIPVRCLSHGAILPCSRWTRYSLGSPLSLHTSARPALARDRRATSESDLGSVNGASEYSPHGHCVLGFSCAGATPTASPFANCSEQRSSVGGCKLYAVCTYDQTLLEGRYRGASLQRQHVPPSHLPRDP